MLHFKDLITAGVHFGHPRTRWCPKMKPYIWGIRNDVHLIDVAKTAQLTERAAQFLKQTAADGKTILWVGTKKAARDIIATSAQKVGMPYVNHRWIGGTISNWEQVKKSLTKLLHYEDILSKTDKSTSLYTKKEYNVFNKVVERLSKCIGGIRTLKNPIGALVVVDVRKEHSAIKEAVSRGIPVVALVDTDGDPSIDYVIPANDDAPRSIKIIIDYLADATAQGKEASDKNREAAKKEAQENAETFAVSIATDDKALLEAEVEEAEGKPASKVINKKTLHRKPGYTGKVQRKGSRSSSE